ncbi:MAG TPA: xanthine dehydrogenase family protein subunit M [Vicinamibacterales bacterium]|nr:xanthine dehydrogenase family protein subunit M [Vicinamibacterales bacterium]
MKPAPFEYFCPDTLEEAMALLAEHGNDAKPLAGGQSLIPAMNFRLATPSVLVDLNAVTSLAHVTVGDRSIRLGGMTRHRTLETNAAIARDLPLVTQTMPFVAHAAIRSRGTIGGSLAHADPAAELPAVMLALQATIKVQKQGGARSVPAAEFFTGLFSTSLEPGEILTEVEVPRSSEAGPLDPAGRGRAGYAFDEVSRRHGDFALAGAAAVVTVDDAGVCTLARVALLSVADRPVIAEQVSRALVGQRTLAMPQLIREAAESSAATDIDPASDIHASSRYRRRLAAVLIRRVLERAFHSLESA